MSNPRTIQVARRPASARPRGTAARRSQHDSDTLLVAILTLAATALAVYDLLLLGLAA